MVYVKRWVGKTEPGGAVSPGIIYCLPVRLVSRAVRVAERGFGRCVVVCVCVCVSIARVGKVVVFNLQPSIFQKRASNFQSIT